MEFNATKVNGANATVSATIKANDIEVVFNKLVKQASKSMDIQGFRKGKVPAAVVKQRYGQKIQQDAEGEAIRDILTKGLKELEIANADLIGEPAIVKFDKNDDGDIDVEIKISFRPEVELGDYKSYLPEVEEQTVTDEEVTKQLEEIASRDGELTQIKRKRMVRDGDFVIIDFEGFKDGVAFDGGKAEKYSLEIGSGSFIPGFEEQLVGMKYEEEKEITVTFPENYQSKDLAGAEAVFKVKLHHIEEKVTPELNDELAKKVLRDEEATLDKLKDMIKDQIKAEKTTKYYREELIPNYLETLVEKIDFDLPDSVLDREIDQAINLKAQKMSEDELKELKENKEKLDEIVEEVKPDAIKSVKATFIVDALAKEENVEVTDQEVTQTLYYEAMMSGQNPTEIIKYYEEAGYLPAIKMSMLEQNVITKLLEEKVKN